MITELTPEQLAQCPVYVDRWTKIGMSTEPVDPGAAKDAINLCYKMAELEPPGAFLFLDSPYQGCYAANACLRINEDVKNTRANNEDVWNQLSQACYGSHDAYWLAFHAYFCEVCELYEETALLKGLWKAARTCGWWWPFEHLVIVSDRPSEIHQSDEGLLHRDNGPAIKYRDGFTVCGLNGVRLPPSMEWIALTPREQIDPRKLVEIDNAEIRREFVRKVGIEFITDALHAECIDEDKERSYKLLLLDAGDGEKRPYLQMLNPSTGLIHVEGVDRGITTIRQAELVTRWRELKDKTFRKGGAEWFQQGDVILTPAGKRVLAERPSTLT